MKNGVENIQASAYNGARTVVVNNIKSSQLKLKLNSSLRQKLGTQYFNINSLFISFSRKFFEPDFEKMKEITVWRKAAEQMFFSLSVSWGGLIMFGSYNKFRHKVHYPALIISSLDFLTSIIAGVVVFSILGHLKFKGKEVYKALIARLITYFGNFVFGFFVTLVA